MKKHLILLVTLTFVLTLVISIPVCALSEQYQTVKIGIYFSSSSKNNLPVSSSGGFYAGYMNNSTFVSMFSMGETSLNVKYQSGNALYINGVSYNFTGGNFALSPVNGTVNINGTTYRGGVEFLPDSSGRLTVVNFVNINDYIAGVVGKEMSPSWPIEALKAQAVCARTFTVASWNKHSHQGFNLCGTQDCQAYQGISGESASTLRAASETKDQVIKYDGKVIQALYSSSNGGSSAYAKYVWGGDYPYLVAVKDNYENPQDNPRSSWTVTLTKSQIKSKLAENSVNIGDITDMRVTGADEYGRTYKVTIYGTNGTYDLSNDRTRNFFGLYSQNYTITSPGQSTASGNVHALSSHNRAPVDSYYIKSSSGVVKNPQGVYVIGTNGISKAPSGVSSSGATSDSFVINGSGWGHGVGMSQYGAKGMASQGFGYRDIIGFYYKGVYIE